MSLFNLLLLPFLFIIFFTFAYADDNSINGICPGEIIEEMDGTTTDVSHTEDGAIGGGGNDRYRIRFPVAGTLDISAVNRNASDNENYRFYVSDTSCGDWNVVNGNYGKSHSATVSVDAGDTVTVRLLSDGSEPNNGRHSYALSLDFTLASTISCSPLRDSDNLTSSHTSYSNSSNYNSSYWNVGPGATAMSRAYHFTVDGPGTVDIDLTRIDQHQAKFSVSQGSCPTTLDGLESSQLTFAAAGDFYVYIYYVNGTHNNIEHQLDVIFTPPTPPVTCNAVDDSFSTLVNTDLTGNTLTNDEGTGISVISSTQPSDGSVVMQADGSFVYTPPNDFSGTTTFTYTISNGATTSQAVVTITITTAPIDAVDDAYTTTPGTGISDNLLVNDSGTGISLTSNTNPSLGTLVIASNGDFTYTPDSNVTGTDTFTYTITDNLGNTATATVTIDVGTDFSSGSYLPFSLINPPDTRNVIGDYKIAGNTVLCLTGGTSGYGGTCIDDEDSTSNQRVSKYLDIDSNGGTWNSTSSYINFDAPYNPARGIIWAGLFWGGRISSDDTYPIRYAVENDPDTFSTVEVGSGGSVGTIDITTTGATNIKLKIDGGNYADILASKFHVSESSGGETYAAFADVSSVLQSANLGLGKHTFTLANLTTMEGREGSPGAFGGWSLVVIYAEDYTNGKPRNISIYNGFIDIDTSNDPIEISGFKLPTEGDVQAQLSVFSGEGEYLYGRNPTNTNEDHMKISDQENSGYGYMPGKTEGTHLGNRDNMFDAQLDNILRDNIPGEYNDLNNNNVGVDVDTYDVSDLMTEYRNNDANISTIYIQMYSNNDYITPSMMAFSAELYVPELCYDYTLDIDGHVLDSINNEIKTPFGGFGKDLTTVIYLKSLEGDIPLSNISANYRILDTSHLTYIDCSTEISETGEYDYSDACPYTYNATDSGFSMYAGKWKTTTSGGVIDALENRYIKFESEFERSSVDTSFEFAVDYTVNYGSGAVPLRKIFTAADLCEPVNEGFLPELGYFSVTVITNFVVACIGTSMMHHLDVIPVYTCPVLVIDCKFVFPDLFNFVYIGCIGKRIYGTTINDIKCNIFI